MVQFERIHNNSSGERNINESEMKNSYTWQQVAEKNIENEAWIIVHGKVCDITGKIRITN